MRGVAKYGNALRQTFSSVTWRPPNQHESTASLGLCSSTLRRNELSLWSASIAESHRSITSSALLSGHWLTGVGARPATPTDPHAQAGSPTSAIGLSQSAWLAAVPLSRL